jgi:hypothetical protein
MRQDTTLFRFFQTTGVTDGPGAASDPNDAGDLLNAE